eukprot:TRINITY_DN10404_c0_g1_i1.p1 TRINITY_DN10404_c0_g1~~TRINITY_DN10404_c0_g1_i1.p1  ORF type:complete len:491 (+),score=27.66 TRINITY_DN10404_c0_g1_i1:36-1508(+)
MDECSSDDEIYVACPDCAFPNTPEQSCCMICNISLNCEPLASKNNDALLNDPTEDDDGGKEIVIQEMVEEADTPIFLPEEIWDMIFSYLGWKLCLLPSASCVCRRWRRISFQHLKLSQNFRTTTSPQKLCKIFDLLAKYHAQIHELDLSDCAAMTNAELTYPTFPRDCLESLSLAKCPYITTVALRSLPRGLCKLDLSECPGLVVDIAIETLPKACPNLQSLILCGYSNCGDIFSSMPPRLQSLDIRNTRISWEGISKLPRKLSHLYINYGKYSEGHDAHIAPTAFPALKFLHAVMDYSNDLMLQALPRDTLEELVLVERSWRICLVSPRFGMIGFTRLRRLCLVNSCIRAFAFRSENAEGWVPQSLRALELEDILEINEESLQQMSQYITELSLGPFRNTRSNTFDCEWLRHLPQTIQSLSLFDFYHKHVPQRKKSRILQRSILNQIRPEHLPVGLQKLTTSSLYLPKSGLPPKLVVVYEEALATESFS